MLFGVGKLVPSLLVCNRQPINVDHNRLFLVDLNTLKSKNDIKCNDSGSWINNSCHKYQFNLLSMKIIGRNVIMGAPKVKR